jgi:hypothetical protein
MARKQVESARRRRYALRMPQITKSGAHSARLAGCSHATKTAWRARVARRPRL